MRGRVTNVNPYICPSITPMATKFDRVATGGGGLLLQRYVTFTLGGHVTNEKKLISTLIQYLWPPNLAEW